MKTVHRLFLGSLALSTAACAGPAHRTIAAEPGAPIDRAPLPAISPEPELITAEREVGELPEPEGKAIAVEGSDLVRGSATVVVQAPIAAVRKHVTRYGSYAKFMPRQRRSNILGKKRDGTTEVYFQWAALHGAMKVWVRAEMRLREEGDVEIYESHLIEGNVDDASSVWRLRPLQGDRTELTAELFFDPSFPIPASVVNDGIVRGAADAVAAMRDRIETP